MQAVLPDGTAEALLGLAYPVPDGVLVQCQPFAGGHEAAVLLQEDPESVAQHGVLAVVVRERPRVCLLIPAVAAVMNLLSRGTAASRRPVGDGWPGCRGGCASAGESAWWSCPVPFGLREATPASRSAG
jgi:hypothetical protein